MKNNDTIGKTNPSLMMDECDKRVCNLFLIDFEQSGIHLDDNTRNNFVKINDQLVNVLMQFQINSQKPSEVTTGEIDPKFSKIMKQYREPAIIETMYINSDDELLREFVYKSYLKPNELQESYFKSILSMRKKQANLCGFKSYSHRANQNMIMETPENVMNFLNEFSKSIWSKSEKDFDIMRDYKNKILKSDNSLMLWDVPFLSNKIKKAKFDIEKSEYMNYFSLGSCMEGLNLILNNLYKYICILTKIYQIVYLF